MNERSYPSYIELFASGELAERVERARVILGECTLCPHRCRADRTSGHRGECGGGAQARVASFHPHFGEEPPLVGFRGSGTIFFSFCPLSCVFCQNWDISQKGAGREVAAGELAKMMLHLEAIGCHNINLVTPTHYVPQILDALQEACRRGLHTPLVYNSGGYESLDTLRLLDGIIDIYMPDMKYADAQVGKRLSRVDDYPKYARAAVKEMHRQVGDLVMDERGVARRGLIIRHLVLPNGLAQTKEVARFITREVSPESYVNIMGQYRPEFMAGRRPEIARRASAEEFAAAVEEAVREGLVRLAG